MPAVPVLVEDGTCHTHHRLKSPLREAVLEHSHRSGAQEHDHDQGGRGVVLEAHWRQRHVIFRVGCVTRHLPCHTQGSSTRSGQQRPCREHGRESAEEPMRPCDDGTATRSLTSAGRRRAMARRALQPPESTEIEGKLRRGVWRAAQSHE